MSKDTVSEISTATIRSCASARALSPLNFAPARIFNGTPPPENVMTFSSPLRPYLFAAELASPPITIIVTPRFASSFNLLNIFSVPVFFYSVLTF